MQRLGRLEDRGAYIIASGGAGAVALPVLLLDAPFGSLDTVNAWTLPVMLYHMRRSLCPSRRKNTPVIVVLVFCERGARAQTESQIPSQPQ
jgi:hypothetical protein